MLRLGRVPHISQETTRAENAPLAAYLSRQLGIPVELAVPSDYDAVISELQAGAVDIAILPPLSYIVAKKRIPDLNLIAQLVADGGAQYLSYIVTPTDSHIETLADLKGKRFAFVDKRSTTGYLMAVDLLRAQGIEAERDFKSIVFAGSHPEVVDLVLAHKVDAGAIASTTFGHMHGLKERLRIIGKSEPVPVDAVVVQPHVPPEMVAKLRETFLRLSTRTEEGRAVLAVITSNNGFMPVSDEAYDGVRRVADTVPER
jgi:phosphonate transport system substrate-binding protein